MSGIYKIICCKNNKFYIGSSVNINRRLKEHIRFLKRNQHKNEYLQNCWNKHGEKNFRFEIIETVNDIKKLLIKEKLWIENTNCCNRKIGFNVSINPLSPRLGSKCSKETKHKMSLSQKQLGRFIDLTGQKFGKLLVTSRSENNKRGQTRWNCKCECGNKTIVVGASLRSGVTKSCGCLFRKGNNLKHGHSHTRTYRIWDNMNKRCTNNNNPAYEYYGGRGITVCKRWYNKNPKGYENFLKDIGEIPQGFVLGRINNNKLKNGYSLKNCKLSTMKQQSRNKSNNILYCYNGKIQCFQDIANQNKINPQTLRNRIKRNNCSLQKALSIPIRKYKKRK